MIFENVISAIGQWRGEGRVGLMDGRPASLFSPHNISLRNDSRATTTHDLHPGSNRFVIYYMWTA